MERTYQGSKKISYLNALAKLKALKASYESKSDGSSVVSMLTREIEELNFIIINWDTLSSKDTDEQENTN
tara:strand:- start:195 stop:404 length:210 start_codon:yes stop_codon:yes gene_type:complete